MAFKLLLLLLFYITILFSLLSTSFSVPSKSILDAADSLMNSGFVSMSLTLQFGSQSILPQSPSLTIFSPPDTAFEESGQPSLSLLQYHFSPLSFSFNSLKSLAPGSKIPTLFANHSLIITSDSGNNSGDDTVSVNGVKINGPALYDDGSLVIFGVERFLDPDFEASGAFRGRTGPILDCPVVSGVGDYDEANGVLRSRGYSTMASFLDLQLRDVNSQRRVTVFAPSDEAFRGLIGNLSDYMSIFLRHVIPCRLLWRGLSDLDNGVVLPTYLEGFNIIKNTSGSVLLLNGVEVLAPDMYSSNWLVIHGIRGHFLLQPTVGDARKPSSGVKRSFSTKIRVNFKVIVLLLMIAVFFQLVSPL